MRKYLFGTGIIGTITSGFSLLRDMRDQQFTWRTILAWLSWGLSLALAIGTIVEIRRESQGTIPTHVEPSPQEQKRLKRMR